MQRLGVSAKSLYRDFFTLAVLVLIIHPVAVSASSTFSGVSLGVDNAAWMRPANAVRRSDQNALLLYVYDGVKYIDVYSQDG